MSNKKRLLLISNSTLHGFSYLDHAEQEIRDFLHGVKTVLFVPFALYDQDAYAVTAKSRFESMGFQLTSIHTAENALGALSKTDAIFIGGGNTFRLLNALYSFDLLEPIRKRVEEGLPYMGSSAGSVVAGPTIKTTNDMPIVQPPSFAALGLVAFQINAHYIDADPHSTHMGETREERLRQYLEENEAPVVGIREGAILRIENGVIVLKGRNGARLFRKGAEPLEIETGATIGDLGR